MKMKTRIRKKLHPTGQLSIFAILIFQVLFILFAMSLNIALVVHDKINLQNSVDLAAYYGAMKQAEMMNTIAHVNYQIRQSWKLLSWRYRVLGSMSQSYYDDHFGPYDQYHTLRPYVDPLSRSSSLRNSNRPGPPFFCLGHPWWARFEGDNPSIGRMHRNEDMMCTFMNHTTPAITVPRATGTLGNLSYLFNGMERMGHTINTQLRDQCNFYAYNSWLLGILSFVHFRRDQANRKFMIKELARVMSGEKYNHPHGTDLNGHDIAEGVRKTFEKNLSFINKKAFERDINQLKQFNSLQRVAPETWLKDQEFLTSAFYSLFKDGSQGSQQLTAIQTNMQTGTGGSCTRQLEYVHNPPSIVARQTATNDLIQEISDHGSWPCSDHKKCNPSAGLRKNINFIIFYTVKVELDYKNQIFLPFNRDIKLKAKAFAKPFGGRIGPDRSADQRLPDFVSSLPTDMDPVRFDRKFGPNYSRYPGDLYGLNSKYVQHYWNRYIRRKAKDTASIKYYYTFGDNDNDPMAKHDMTGARRIVPRKWELAAVAPDLFDITYFTILPYYTYTHFPKVRNLLGHADYIRGDLGMYKVNHAFQGTSILHQVGFDPTDHLKNVWLDIRRSASPTPFRIPFFYKVGPTKLNLLLTGWNPPKKKYLPGDNEYQASAGKTNFAHCHQWVHNVLSSPTSGDTKGKIANGCIFGGRTGYSVKMISEGFLRGFGNTMDNPPNLGDPDWY